MSISRRFRRKPLHLSKLDKMVGRIAEMHSVEKKQKLNQARIRAERAMKKMEKRHPMIAKKIHEAIEAENGNDISTSRRESAGLGMNQRASQDRRTSDDSLYALANEERRVNKRRCDST